MPIRTLFVFFRHSVNMDYFDDFELLSVTHVKMYGASRLQNIATGCFYLGLMRGSVYVNERLEERPFIYFTPRGINTPNGWNSPAGRWRDNFYMECQGRRVERLFEAWGAANCVQHIFLRNAEPYAGKFTEMEQLFRGQSKLSQARAALCFEELALLLTAEAQTDLKNQAHAAAIQDFMFKVSDCPGAAFDLQAEAGSCGITLRHWSRLFTAAAGMPPGRFINSCRMQLARKLLSESIMPIKVIAGECGFCGVSEFTRFFRQHCGMTPGEFRRSRLN